MADFEAAYQTVLRFEGGYADHPDDRGGETYKGIARKMHPDWPGWDRIDQYKNSDKFPYVLDSDHALKGWIKDFYRDNYWDAIGGDKLINQQDLANFLFEYAVHVGPSVAIKHLQRALNVLNRKATLWVDLLVDGRAGPRTLRAVESYFEWEGPYPLHKALVGLRTAYYIECVERREQNEAFIRGWLNRLRIR